MAVKSSFLRAGSRGRVIGHVATVVNGLRGGSRGFPRVQRVQGVQGDSRGFKEFKGFKGTRNSIHRTLIEKLHAGAIYFYIYASGSAHLALGLGPPPLLQQLWPGVSPCLTSYQLAASP
jgi:hypothetical protein